jgi:hypothetical protein
LLSIPNVPTLTNRLCASEAEAANAQRGDINLVHCRDCGHVVNAAFDQGRVKYDGRFENTLTFSSRYRQYAEATAARIINRYGLHGKCIVEIGCSTSDFLRLLCGAGNYGKGSIRVSRRANRLRVSGASKFSAATSWPKMPTVLISFATATCWNIYPHRWICFASFAKTSMSVTVQ